MPPRSLRVITDISPLNSQAQERLGYPTQKPLSPLERIISASSNEGDLILDPFCGCGTTIHAAEKLHRHWIGIDITHLAISLIEKRLRDADRASTRICEGRRPSGRWHGERLDRNCGAGKAKIGIFITLAPPTRPMTTEALSAGLLSKAGQ
jgi:hypothetical protein